MLAVIFEVGRFWEDLIHDSWFCGSSACWESRF